MTVVSEIIEAYINRDCYDLLKWIGNNKERLLESEKQQIIDAYHINPLESKWSNIGEDYYNETYKNR